MTIKACMTCAGYEEIEDGIDKVEKVTCADCEALAPAPKNSRLTGGQSGRVEPVPIAPGMKLSEFQEVPLQDLKDYVDAGSPGARNGRPSIAGLKRMKAAQATAEARRSKTCIGCSNRFRPLPKQRSICLVCSAKAGKANPMHQDQPFPDGELYQGPDGKPAVVTEEARKAPEWSKVCPVCDRRWRPHPKQRASCLECAGPNAKAGHRDLPFADGELYHPAVESED